MGITMGLREANQNFSKAVKLVKEGKAIVLTERGKPVATITPISADSGECDELQALRDEGFLLARSKGRAASARTRRIRVAGSAVSKALLKERDED